MKSAMIFLCGVALGIGGTLLYVKKSLIPELELQIREKLSEEQYGKEVTEEGKAPADIFYGKEEEDEEVVVTNPKAKMKAPSTAKTDYSKYAKDFEKKVAEKKDGENAKELTEVGGTDPYVIDEESYDTFSTYTAHAFEVYSDGVVFDIEENDILDADPVLIFGQTALDELSSAPDGVIFVRDDAKQRDYRLERRDCPFDGPEEAYMSPDPDNWRE